MPAILDVNATLGAVLVGCFVAIACVLHPHLLRSIADSDPYHADSRVSWPFRHAFTFACTHLTSH